jgi:hypothetical protein
MNDRLIVLAMLAFVFWLAGISLPTPQKPMLFQCRFGRIGIPLVAVVLAVLGLLI